jgi:agmatinase
MEFDPDAAGKPGSGIFGLPFSRTESKVIVLPVPFDATTSYGYGTHRGPDAVLRASMQVDLYDRRFGRTYEKGIYLEQASSRIAELSTEGRRLALPLIEKGGAEPGDADAVARIDAAGEEVNEYVYEQTRRILEQKRAPGLLGGDHSTPFGAIRACAEFAGELGILQFDAHMDFREAYEGFRWSHASIMYNVLVGIPQVCKLVQVGIRDFGEGEMDYGIEQGRRVETYFDDAWAAEIAEGGTTFMDLCRRVVGALPPSVYISFDIDALDPGLCPHTGTPVPGGLSFNQVVLLLDVLKQSGRRIVGFDLVEVSPGPDGDEWDANVGARVLYKLCGVI